MHPIRKIYQTLHLCEEISELKCSLVRYAPLTSFRTFYGGVVRRAIAFCLICENAFGSLRPGWTNPNLVPRACLSTTLAQGVKCWILIGRSKTHNARSKMLESRHINIAKTDFRGFRQTLCKATNVEFSPAKLLSKNHWCLTRSTPEQNGPNQDRLEGNIFSFKLTIVWTDESSGEEAAWAYFCTCYDTNESAWSWKANASRTLFGPWIYWPPCYCYRSRSTCTLKILITVTQMETRRLNMTVQRWHISWQGAWCWDRQIVYIGFSTGKRQKCKDVGPNTTSINYPHAMGRPDLWLNMQLHFMLNT